MLPSLRRLFNDSCTEAQHRTFTETLERRLDGPVPFPVSETPCFFARPFLQQLASTGLELIEQSLQPPALDGASALTPPQFRGPGEGEHPLFVQVDFGLVRGVDGCIEPRLVELQAFPSLYGFQLILAETFLDSYPQLPPLGVFLDVADRQSYLDVLRACIVGTHAPEHVVLLEIDPARQKTRPDFVATEQLWGVRAIDTRDVQRDGRELWYWRDGRRVRIARIYNRVIADEMERTGTSLPFRFDQDLEVEWAGHPSWYFRISKASIPWLRHRAVPRTWRLEEVDRLPDTRENLLLKPLFSFAGGGIIFAPSEADLAAIPAARRREYILQERVQFTPVIDTPHGATQAEIRVMYAWVDRPRPLVALVRMGRGRMMGVDHNKGLRWVGASAALIGDTEET